ncbi:MAG: NADH:flavin oxidoreductase [Acidimicrobiales bacterium]|nr:NADH:flavin oxidoreductase [Acidimicrobiales bacterium]
MPPSDDPLLRPLEVGGLTLRNRVFSSSHAPGYCRDGLVTDRYVRYHEEKAVGGIGLTMIGGSTNVAPDSPSLWGQLYAGDDDVVPGLRRLADAVHAHGAAVMCQITHMGRRTIWDDGHWLPTIAPSRVREPAHRSFPKVMDEADIRRVLAAYAAGARRVAEAGLDGVEVIAYGHLVDQFWSPAVNRRTDRWGGSLDNRLRFGFEVLEAIRDAIGDLPLGIRLSGDERLAEGLDQGACVEIARRLASSGLLDFVNVVSGNLATDPALAEVIPPMGAPLAAQLPVAAAVKEAVDLPVFHAGRIPDLATARHAVEAGLVDLVGMTRGHIADPHIVAKLERGEEERIRTCVGASFCLNRIYVGQDALCIQNPATGREATIPQVTPPSSGPSRRVVVVGAGPAGLEAARVSAERGHDVVLFEAAPAVGGQLRLAARASARQRDLLGIVDWLEAEVRLAGVDLRLDTPADAGDVLAESPDVVVVASGGWPDVDVLPSGATGGDLLVGVADVVAGQAGPDAPGSSVLVYDDHGNVEALSCIEYLLDRGHRVELVTPDRMVGHELIGTVYPAYLERFHADGVVLTPDHRLVAVERGDAGLEAVLANAYTGAVQRRTVDLVAVEHGTVPNDDLFQNLAGRADNGGVTDLDTLLALEPQPDAGDGFDLHRIGDALASRNVYAALHDARRLCQML